MGQPTINDVLIGITGLEAGQIRVDERLKRVDGRLKNIDNKIETIQNSHNKNATQIALINQRCTDRDKILNKLSDNMNNEKISGVAQIVEKDTAVRVIKWVGGILITLTGLALTIIKVLN